MEIITKTRFEKDVKKLKKRHKDFSKLEKVLRDLSAGNKIQAIRLMINIKTIR